MDTDLKELRTEPKARIFISYSRKDMAFADRLEGALKAREFEPLIDRTEIYAFEDWWKRIEGLIGKADTVVFVLSPDAVASEVALKEIAHAASLNKRFAPIVCRSVANSMVPEPLRRLNFIFFEDLDRFEASADQLTEALTTDIGWIRQHTEFGELARRWSAAGRPGGLLLRSPALEEAERWIGSRPRGAPEPTPDTQSFVAESRRGATRRRNILTGSLTGGLVLALCLAGLAFWQRGIAVEQRQIAQQNEARANTERDNATRNFKLAQKTADSLVLDIARGLRNVQGMSAQTVRKILQTAQATFDQLAASAPNDFQLQRSRLMMLNEFGDTYLTLGDLDEALNAFRGSRAILLAAPDPNNATSQHDLMVSYEKIGDVLLRQGQLDASLQSYRDELAVMEHLTALKPDDAEWQHDLARSHQRIADVLKVQGKVDEALKEYREDIGITERLATADPTNTDWQAELSVSYERLGDVLAGHGKPNEALKAYQDGLTIRERLIAVDPSNTLWQRNLSVSHDKIGDVLMEEGKLDEALKAYRDEFVIAERLAAADRSNTVWQRDLAISYGKIGDVLMDQGKLDDALKEYHSFLAIAQRLTAADQSNTQWQHDLSVSHERIGDALMAQGDSVSALKEYEAKRDIIDQLAAADRGNKVLQRALSISYNKIGNALVAQGKLDEALKAYRQDLVIVERLTAVDAGNTQWQRDLQVSIGRIGEIAYDFLLVRNFAIGLEAVEQALSLAPGKRWLYEIRAHALMLLDRTDEARTLYLKYRGQKLENGKTWEVAILGDFAELRKAGLTNPLMDEVEKLFTSAG